MFNLSSEMEKDIWKEVLASPYTWDHARVSLQTWQEAGREIPKGTQPLKVMSYGHRCCSQVFRMWGVDAPGVKTLLGIK